MAYWLMDSPIDHISQVPAGSAPMDLTTSSWQLAGIPEGIGKAVVFWSDSFQTL